MIRRSTKQRSARRRRFFAPEMLESRRLLAGNLTMVSVRFVDVDHVPLTAPPTVGEQVFIQAEWTSTNLDLGQNYIVRFEDKTAGKSIISIDSATFSPVPGNNVPFTAFTGGWYASPGQHNIEVTLDATNQNVETTELDNRMVLNYVPLAPDLPEKWVQPLSGEQNVDWAIVNYPDLWPKANDFRDYQCDDIFLPLSQKCGSFSYDGSRGMDFQLANFAAMDDGQPVYAVASGVVSAGLTGEVINGIKGGDAMATISRNLGDINGDGQDDYLFTGPTADVNGFNRVGEVYVLYGQPGGYPNTVELSDLLEANGGDGSQGFVIQGMNANDQTGLSVSPPGDFNGDGLIDLAIGTPFSDPNGVNAGRVWVLFGQAAGFPAEIDIRTLLTVFGGDGTQGVAFNGIVAGDNAGQSVAIVGDLNGDGYQELAIGAPRASGPNFLTRQGHTYIVYGGPGPDPDPSGTGTKWPAEFELLDLRPAGMGTGKLGFTLYGESNFQNSGFAVSSAGDLNGDGVSDLAIGAPGSGFGALTGDIYVVYGRTASTFSNSPFTPAHATQLDNGNLPNVVIQAFADQNEPLGPTTLVTTVTLGSEWTINDRGRVYIAQSQGTQIDISPSFPIEFPLAHLQTGQYLFTTPAVTALDRTTLDNGTVPFTVIQAFVSYRIPLTASATTDPLTVGSEWRLTDGSNVYILRSSGTALDVYAEKTQGVMLQGPTGGGIGRSMAAMPDLNGDGRGEFFIGATTGGATSQGQVYILNGAGMDFPTRFELDDLQAVNGGDGTLGTVINGAVNGDRVGTSFDVVGDMNADSIPDVLIGAPGGNAAYLLYASATGLGAEINLIDTGRFGGPPGVVFTGANAGDRAGQSVADAGDLNGDGLADILIGASQADPNGNSSGQAYIVYGQDTPFRRTVDLSLLTNIASGGVEIDHGNGWITRYEHLEPSSITVRPGDTVGQGEVLGLVGTRPSGSAQLHFEVEHNKSLVETNLDPTSYWLRPLEYQGFTDRQALAVGVTNVDPTADLEELPSSVRYLHPTYTGPIYFWFRVSHLNPRDEYQVNWHLPNGAVIPGTYHCLFPKGSPIFGPRCDSVDNSPVHMGIGAESLTLPWKQYSGNYYVTLTINGQERAREFFSLVSSPIEPEMRVTFGTATLGNPIAIDGRTTPIDYGIVPQDDPRPQQTFTIENHGSTALHISSLIVPEGFALVGTAPTLINPTESANFVVEMRTDVVGAQFGALRILSDDTNEADFHVYLAGEVLGTPGVGDPRVSLPGPAAYYLWNDVPQQLDPQANVFDVDSPTFVGGRLTVELVGTSALTDRLAIRNQGIGLGQVAVVGGDVFYEGALVGALTGGAGSTPLQVDFNSQATLEAVRVIVRQITYASVAPEPGTTPRFARYTLVDDTGNVSNHPVKMIVVAPSVLNDLPVVTGLTVTPTLVTVPNNIVATASGVADNDGFVAAVEFYREANNISGLQTGPGGDQLLGTDSSGTDGWSLQFSSSLLPVGVNILYAQAIDDRLARSQGAVANVTVQPANLPPEIVFVSATPSVVVQPNPVALSANGVSDPDGVVVQVNFYRETNLQTGLQTGVGGDTLIGTDNSVLGGWIATLDTNGIADGKQTIYAQAVDALGGVSVAASVQIQVGQLPPVGSVFLLSELLAANGGDGSSGFVLNGQAAGDALGQAVSGAGDVNGDGFDDFIVGAPGGDLTSPTRADAGQAYVVFGNVFAPGAELDVATLTGANGFKIIGLRAGDGAASTVRSAGDMNGDTFTDIIVTSASADPASGIDAGEAYVVFGKPVGFPAVLDLATLNGVNGFRMAGLTSGDLLGISASGAGDVNGDGFADLIVGSSGASPGSPARAQAGKSYLLFGTAAGFPASLNLAGLNGTNGMVIEGMTAQGRVGLSASGAGDVNADGFADIVVGAQDGPSGAGLNKGVAYVIFGHASPWTTPLELDTLGGVNGFRVDGLNGGDAFGWSTAGLGDVNGDGIDDLAFGAPGADPGSPARVDAGAAYVLFGNSAGFAGSIDLTTLDGTNGFVVEGAAAGDSLGYSVAAAGDVNSDGLDDLVVGAYLSSPGSPGIDAAGTVYVVFGRTPPISATLNVSALNGQNGFRLEGVAIDDHTGFSVAGRFDFNGDGFDDLLLGAPQASPGSPARTGAGQAFVFLGRNFTSAVSQIGDENANTLTGDPGPNVIVAGANHDTVMGQGGSDALRGGQGNDILAVSDLTFRRVDGGRGVDTLRLDGAGFVLNLGQALITNRVRSVEIIDISGSGNNELVIDQRSVLNASDTSNLVIVKRNTGDIVTMDSGWALVAIQDLDGVSYNVFQQGAATLLVAAVAEGTPWQNPANPLDTTNDGATAPNDALVTINYLNENPNAADPLPNPPLPGFAPPPLGTEWFYDVNGDGYVSAIDALLVINFLNATSGGEGEAASDASPLAANLFDEGPEIVTRRPSPTLDARNAKLDLRTPSLTDSVITLPVADEHDAWQAEFDTSGTIADSDAETWDDLLGLLAASRC